MQVSWLGSKSNSMHPYIIMKSLKLMYIINPGPAEPGYALPLQTVWIQIGWLLMKPTDLDLHCLALSMWIWITNLAQIILLAEN